MISATARSGIVSHPPSTVSPAVRRVLNRLTRLPLSRSAPRDMRKILPGRSSRSHGTTRRDRGQSVMLASSEMEQPGSIVDMVQHVPRSPDARLSLGTATPGGGFPLYGAALVEAVREVDATLLIEPRNTKG